MMKITKKDIAEVCNEIDLIIAGNGNKMVYDYIYLHLMHALEKELIYDDIVLICETTLKIAKTKNRILRYLEKDFWEFIGKIPCRIDMIDEFVVGEGEELLSNIDYDDTNKRIFSRLLGLAQEIIELKEDNSKCSILRRVGSLNLLGEMIDFYHIPFAKNLFVDSIKSKNTKEQYAALEGLSNYYNITTDELEADLRKTLGAILKKTDDRCVASTCLQVQINAGIINKSTAVAVISRWKDKHYY